MHAHAQVALGPEDAYMVLCSDGIYEFMSNDDIVGLVHGEACRGATPADIARLLVRASSPLPCPDTRCSRAI